MTAEHGQQPDADHRQLNPERIHQLKERILTAWDKLPAEHRATMTLVLLENTLQSEWGEWLGDVIELGWGKEQEPSERTFPVISLSRSALKRAFNEEEVVQFTDNEIAQVAEEIGIGLDADPGFWYSVETIGRRLLQDRDLGSESKIDLHQTETDQIPEGNDSSFSNWMEAVDQCVWMVAGCSVYDLPDCDFRSMFEEGATPAEMANEALLDAGFDLLE